MEATTKKILIIDDAADLAEAMATALMRAGFEVHTARNGADGLTDAFAYRPDLIFLDLTMPQKGGLDVLTRLREDEWGRTVIVVVTTVHEDMEHIADAISQGGDAYILKNNLDLFEVVNIAKEKLGILSREADE